MSAANVARIALLALAVTLSSLRAPAYAAPANPILAAGQPVDATLHPRERRIYSTAGVKEGDFVTGSVDQIGISIRLELLGERDVAIRAWHDISRGKYRFAFVASGPPPYRLAVSSEERHEGAYAVAIDSAVSAQVEPAAPPEPASARLQALLQELARKPAALEEFWAAVRREGAPLIEPIDEKSFRVTFVWRADPDTREVLLKWVLPPFEAHPLARLPGTDVWYRSETLPKGARFTYQLAPNPPDAPGGIQATAQADPLNSRRFGGEADVDQWAQSSLVELPGAVADLWSEPRAGVRRGRVEKTRFPSRILGNDREIAVYTPDGYSKASEPLDLLVVLDEEAYLDQVPTPVILDNLIAAKKIRATLALMLGNSSSAGRNRELPANPDFAKFVAQELMPWLHARYNVTRDPVRSVIAGSSYGGLAAAYTAFTCPDLFGNVLSQSGSFWWSPTRDPANPAKLDAYSEPGWLVREFAHRPTLPVRFYMEAGWFEGGEGGGILDTNRYFRDILRAKGYVVHYREFRGGHEYVNWRSTFADGLIALSGIGG
jgi:enterochelin esterase family protein